MCAQVTSNVWIGAQELRQQTKWLCDHGIRLIVDCRDTDSACDGPDVDGYARPSVHRCGMRDDDRVHTNPWTIRHRIERLNAAACVIQASVARGEAVLVHCASGVNRSAMVIAWWLMLFAEPRHTYRDALTLLTRANESRGEPVLINEAFKQFLLSHADSSAVPFHS